MTYLPKSRQSEVVVQNLGKDLLVYDLKTHQAFQLNETSMIVFEACAAGLTFEDLMRRHKFTEDLIYLTLDTLAKRDLLAGEYRSKLAAVSRREAIRRVGLGTMIALPIITGLIAPTAAHAASGCTSVGGCKCPGSSTMGTSFVSSADCLAIARSQCCSGNGTVLDPGFCAGGACVCQVTCT